MITVHYIYDPMCGWCYGAAPLIQVLASRPGVELMLHPGGMMERTALSDDFRSHVLEADQRIATLTGQTFGDAYLNKVRTGAPITLDSYLTAQAVIAVQQAQHPAFEMLKRIQNAHYVHGLDVSERTTLDALAHEMGIRDAHWQQSMREAESRLTADIDQTRLFMAHWGLSGFPSLVVEQDGEFRSVQLSRYYGRLPEWQTLWQSLSENAAFSTHL